MSDGWKLVLRTDEDGASVVWLDDSEDRKRIGVNAIIVGSGATPLSAYRDALGELARLTGVACARIQREAVQP